MSNYKQWSLAPKIQLPFIVITVLILYVITGLPLLQAASATSKQMVPPKQSHHRIVKHAARTRKPAKSLQAAAVRQSHAQQRPAPAIAHPVRLVSPFPVSNHSLAFVNARHLQGVTHPLATHTVLTISHQAPARTVSPVQRNRNIVDFVDNTVYNLNYSSYRLGGGRFDTSNGIYVVDCSRFVDSVLSRVYPAAYSNLVDASGANRPASQHYFDFFSDLSPVENDVHWNKVEKVGQLRAGDILVFRYKKPRGKVQGHVMVIMDKPRAAENAWLVRVADSAPVRHSADTRQRHESGIGIGTLLLKSSPSGKPAAYAWGMGSSWRSNVKFAMARPLKVEV